MNLKLASPALFRYGIFVGLFTFAFDQAHKWFMIHMSPVTERVIEVAPFLDLVMVWNTGISFGLFRNNPYSQHIFSGLSLTIVAILLVWLSKIKNLREAFAVGIICGGALGNVTDRLIHGAVADFFYFHLGEHYWPAFNIADSAVFIGAAILCYASLFTEPKTKEDKNAKVR